MGRIPPPPPAVNVRPATVSARRAQGALPEDYATTLKREREVRRAEWLQDAVRKAEERHERAARRAHALHEGIGWAVALAFAASLLAALL